MIIAICGPDGSGKTTYIKYSEKYFKSQRKNVKVFYPFNYFILRKIINLFKGKSKKIKSFNKDVKYNKNPLLKLWPFFAIIDNWIDYFFRIKTYKGVAICERYYYDLATSFSEFGYTYNWLYKLYLYLIPKPDICIILNTKAEILSQRETGQKHNINFFKRQVKRYESINKKFSFSTIDVDQSKEKCMEEIKKIFNENK